ncbi:hypothetical protein [Christensenella intestinihominis]|uniref:hypothetical protein n=1 Tax=Christensenella intestinihominis TaxID=1851429 RepID=UPI00082ABD66|nr:hypothetical protein [Christensenella intestinihominis]
MDQKTFWREQTSQKTKSYIIWGVLGGAFLCLNALISMSFYGALALISVALVGGLTLGMYFKQSRVCALVLLVLFVLSNGISAYFIQLGVMEWILIVVFGYALVCGMLGTFSFQKEWRAYKNKNALPPNE